ncbi:MAG: hypothetical protein U1A78_41710 [Polyangia bacterium]
MISSKSQTSPAERLREHLQPGDTLTHSRCMGYIEEHVFTGWDGEWICGRPTHDTRRWNGSKYAVNDIAPGSVTHVNRMPVCDLHFWKGLRPRDGK